MFKNLKVSEETKEVVNVIVGCVVVYTITLTTIIVLNNILNKKNSPKFLQSGEVWEVNQEWLEEYLKKNNS